MAVSPSFSICSCNATLCPSVLPTVTLPYHNTRTGDLMAEIDEEAFLLVDGFSSSNSRSRSLRADGRHFGSEPGLICKTRSWTAEMESFHNVRSKVALQRRGASFRTQVAPHVIIESDGLQLARRI